MSLKKMESIPALLETAPTRIDELKLKLQELKKEIQVHPNNLQKLEEIRKTREELLSLQREFNRTKQYTTISNNRLAEWKTSLDNIDASSLMRIDKETSKDTRGEFLSRSFLYKRLTDSEWNISELPIESEKIKDWDELFVDLGKSTSRKSAYWKIGLGDMLPVWIWYVSVNGRFIRIEKRRNRDFYNLLLNEYTMFMSFLQIFLCISLFLRRLLLCDPIFFLFLLLFGRVSHGNLFCMIHIRLSMWRYLATVMSL